MSQSVLSSPVSALLFKSLCCPLCMTLSVFAMFLGGQWRTGYKMDYLPLLHGASVHSFIQQVITKFETGTHCRTLTKTEWNVSPLSLSFAGGSGTQTDSDAGILAMTGTAQAPGENRKRVSPSW